MYGRRTYEMRNSQRWERGVYGMVSKINYKSVRLPSFLVMASSCVLGPWQCPQALFLAPVTFIYKLSLGTKPHCKGGDRFCA